MNGSFLDVDHDIFRQSPSSAVDAAWDELTMHGIAYVSREDVIKMGWDVEVVAKLAPELNVGPDAYAVETDIIHKIHCLNMVRKDLYFDYYWGEMYPDGKPSERHQLHTNHCLYILLQSLMCDANTDLIPQVWMEDYPWPIPNFNINRKCGNLEAVREWERTHRVAHNERYSKVMTRPEGQKGLPISDEFRRVFEVGT
jgi:hypothetical protein